MSKVLRTIKGLLISGVAFALVGCVMALTVPAVAWLAAVIRYYPHDLLIPMIGEVYASFPHGKTMLFGSVIVFFLGGLIFYPLRKLEDARWIKRYDRSREWAAADTVSGEKVFYYDRSDLWIGLVIGPLFSVSSLGILYFPITMIADTGTIGYGSIALAAIALVSAALFSNITRTCIGIMKHRGPALIIGPAGIQAHQLGPDTIPWGKIVRVRCFAGQIMLTLDPSARLRRSLFRFLDFRGKPPWSFGREVTKLTINLRILLVTENDMVQTVQQFAPKIAL